MPVSVSCGGALAILDAAAYLFARDGYASVSVADIAGHAGVSKANVFHHYLSKEALYFEVMRKASEDPAIFAEKLIDQPGSFAGKVADLIDFEIRWMFEDESRTWLLMREASERGHPRVRRLGRQVFQRNFSAVVRIFEEGKRRGEFRDTLDPAAAAMLLFGATNLFFRSHEVLSEMHEMHELKNRQAYARRIGAMILDGMVAPASVRPAKARAGKAAAGRTAGGRRSPRGSARPSS